ncbi:MAG: PAS domain-containing protein, partial [Angelakisella sp.]
MKVPRRGQREKTVGLLLIASSLLVSVLAVVGFALSLKGMVDKRTTHLMSDAVQQYAQTVTASVVTKLNATTTIADILGGISTTDPTRMKTIMSIAAHRERFRQVVASNLKGEGLNHEGELLDMSKDSCFQKAAQGQPVICDALACTADKPRMLAFAVPIKTDKGIRGVLSCEYELSLLESTTKTDRYFGEAYGMVVDSKGMPITWEQHKNAMAGCGNIMEVFSKGTMMGGMTLEQLKDNMANQMSGTFSIEYLGQNRLVSYTPLKVNDWYAFCFASFAIYQQETVEVSRIVTVLVLEILLGLGAVFLYIMRNNRHHSRLITAANTRYEGLIANVRGGLEVTTFTNRLAEMEVIYVNAGFTEITGYTYEDFWTLWDGKLYRHIYEKDWEWVSKQIENLSDDCWEYSMEYRIVHKDGRIIWVMDRGRVVEGEEGVLQYQSVLTDISDIKEQQERLAISEERFRIAIESADNIMFDYDCVHGGYVDFANSERMMGKTKEQINADLAHTYTMEERERTVIITRYFYHPDDFDMIMEKSKEALDKGEVSVDARVRNGEG